jgi:uncharacterized RDD family membrane protein YckC
VVCALLSVAAAATLRSGIWLRAFGIAVVTRGGDEASRLRAAARAFVAWSWLLVGLAAQFQGLASVALLAVLIGMVAVARAGDHPDRGPHDHVTGTWLVPR